MSTPLPARCAARAVVTAMLMLLGAAAPATGGCLADCDEDGEVAIDELVTAVAVALGNAPPGACSAFACAPPSIAIGCLVRAVGNALLGCPPPTATPSLPPSRCRSAADCDPSSQQCLEVGGFAGCGICYPDDVIDTEFQRAPPTSSARPGSASRSARRAGPARRATARPQSACTVAPAMVNASQDIAVPPADVRPLPAGATNSVRRSIVASRAGVASARHAELMRSVAAGSASTAYAGPSRASAPSSRGESSAAALNRRWLASISTR